jgi:hypothetical protein
MDFLVFILAFICALAVMAFSLVVGSWIYFKLEDFYYFLQEKLSRK